VRVLSVTHGANVTGGVFDEVALASGHELERWVVPAGDAPGRPADYDAIMVFGSSTHPDQDELFPWLPREAAFLREALDGSVPTFGVCLGGQMLARAGGAWVGPASRSEVGWYEVELTDAGRKDPVLACLGERAIVFQWHSYSFGIPAGGAELAISSACSQAFRVGPSAWGIQFHAEVTDEMVRLWAEEDPEDVDDATALLAETTERIGAWNATGRALCEAFLAAASN
jgi:GMP synthase (glutamine-hydrolysing)